MAYTPHTWATGETITAELMNNIDKALRRAASGIQAHHLGTQTLQAATQFLVSLTGVRYISGDGFELGSNEIICNYDGCVAVSARVYCNGTFTAGDQFILSIGLNSNVVESTCHKMQSAGGETVVTKTCLIEVKAGDVIKLKGQNSTGARGVIGNSSGTYANSLTAHYLA
jgi:hypothetical protein